MYTLEKMEILKTALALKENNLITLAGGNVSCRLQSGDYIVTPSGMSYDGMRPDDLIVYNKENEIIEGHLRPSVDTIALQYIYRHMSAVNAIIHTHQPYATAAGLVADTLPVAVTTLSNVTLGEVHVAPYSNPGSLEMGIQTVEYSRGKRAVILKHHGVVTIGDTLKEALYAAVYMETAAQTYLLACGAGTPALMTEEQNQQAVDMFVDYGQK